MIFLFTKPISVLKNIGSTKLLIANQPKASMSCTYVYAHRLRRTEEMLKRILFLQYMTCSLCTHSFQYFSWTHIHTFFLCIFCFMLIWIRVISSYTIAFIRHIRAVTSPMRAIYIYCKRELYDMQIKAIMLMALGVKLEVRWNTYVFYFSCEFQERY